MLDDISNIKYLTTPLALINDKRNMTKVNNFPTAAVHIIDSELGCKLFVRNKSFSSELLRYIYIIKKII